MLRKIIIPLIFVSFVGLAFFVRSLHRPKRFEERCYMIGTMVQLVLVLDSDKSKNVPDLFASAYREIHRLELIFSRYRNDSEVSFINSHPEQTHHLSAELTCVIAKSLEIYRQSDQAFDITIFPFIQMWSRAKKQNCLPRQKEIFEVSQYVGSNRVIFSQQEKTFRMPKGMFLDLGGIAKAYIVQSIRDIWAKKHVKNALINIGGDVWAMGLTEKKRPWKMGIQDPYSTEDIVKTVALMDSGIVTSGDYQRYVTIQGKQYSHIIDPSTGWPVERIKSITLWGKDLLKMDAWATACSVLGPRKIENFLPKMLKAHYLVLYEELSGKHSSLQSV